MHANWGEESDEIGIDGANSFQRHSSRDPTISRGCCSSECLEAQRQMIIIMEITRYEIEPPNQIALQGAEWACAFLKVGVWGFREPMADGRGWRKIAFRAGQPPHTSSVEMRWRGVD